MRRVRIGLLALFAVACTGAYLGQRPREGQVFLLYGEEVTVEYWLLEDDGHFGKLSRTPEGLPRDFHSGERMRVWGVPYGAPRVERVP